jgi:hypothetical protein
MKTKNNNMHLPNRKIDTQKVNHLPGYPIYPKSEDIYSNYMKEEDLNPEDISKLKETNEIISGNKPVNNDLDIPGSELDDNQEDIGSEDEENNYYSLGGDDHNDLDEDQGE